MSQIAQSGASTLTAFFDSRDDAQDAVDRLVDAGIPATSIRLVPGNQNPGSATADVHEHKGFLDSLADFFMPDEDRYSYAEGLRRGGYLVTVTGISSALYDRAVDILDDEGAVDFDSREQQWRTEGWTGYQGGAMSATTGSATSAGRDYAATSERDSGVIPVVEEELRVGKRVVETGRVRVSKTVHEHEEFLDEPLMREEYDVERVPVDAFVDGPVGPRHEGDGEIVPNWWED